jgi:hypothetical protein
VCAFSLADKRMALIPFGGPRQHREQRQQSLEALEMLRRPGVLSPHDVAAVVVLGYGIENNMGISRPGEE